MKIRLIPVEIVNLTNLKVHDVPYNNIKTVPKEIVNLVKIKKLCISSNKM